MVVPAIASSAGSGAVFTSNVPSALRVMFPSFEGSFELEDCGLTKAGTERNAKMQIMLATRCTVTSHSVEIIGWSKCGIRDLDFESVGEFEDPYLNQFCD